MSFTARSSVRESFGGGACLFLSVVPSEELTEMPLMRNKITAATSVKFYTSVTACVKVG